MPSFIHSTFSQPRSCSKNDWRIMQQNKFKTRLGPKMFGRTQMEFRSCSGHVSNHQEWGQNPTGSLCICGISLDEFCYVFIYMFCFSYIKEWLKMLIFKMERYGIKDKFLIETGKIFFLPNLEKYLNRNFCKEQGNNFGLWDCPQLCAA